MSIGLWNGKTAAVSTTAQMHRMRKLLERMRLASSVRPAPMLMLISGAPPTPTRKAKAPSMVTTGPQTPTPASAVSPVTGMLLMYILSTME